MPYFPTNHTFSRPKTSMDISYIITLANIRSRQALPIMLKYHGQHSTRALIPRAMILKTYCLNQSIAHHPNLFHSRPVPGWLHPKRSTHAPHDFSCPADQVDVGQVG